jgi:sulfate adenylyltransferase
MRYAGPRESLFHAIIRRNYGCTHFIIGRDHAGVGNFYKKYEAHELATKFEKELNIKIMKLCGPFYCKICDGIVTEKTCNHTKINTFDISGTYIRNILLKKGKLDNKFIRKEIIKSLEKTKVFI